MRTRHFHQLIRKGGTTGTQNLLPRIKGYDYQEDKKKSTFYLLPNPVMVPSEINFSLSPLN
uniref:Uncharacterized protein n=1 Tax=Klebsiella pneumoniae TaxID=573 RepID=A0A8B0SRS0_KLEPN|nr:hypothetical protein [Klebsiella pneumoniae]